ncbi:DUF6390 family protein [Actinoplanes subtropicus]|uniref:DUF6390 family protein n=1 Tax=Actinoplanes subtropicus TaxID=543632 RepID=UPI001B801DB8|nr:DUF6390 family protein [Actinoplanes subtropicus]
MSSFRGSAEVMSDSGALLFARYAYPPNELGYCGPSGAAELLRADLPGEIARRARGFSGAWAYLEYLSPGDPLDPAVVEAYWVGNDLLATSDFSDLLGFLGTRFVGQRGGTWESAGGRALPHHSFHVFEVYPWAAMLRRTGNPTAVSVLDRCRIRTGKVVSVAGETARVTSRPLVWDGSALAPGPPREESVAWSAGGRSLLAGLSPGDLVALHWDWVCDVITAAQAGRIEALEERQLRASFPSPESVVPPV